MTMGLHRNIYIADSDIAELEISARALTQEGLSVSTFHTGQELVWGLSHAIPCCVVCNASLADLNAVRLMDILANKERYVPVVFMDKNPTAPVIVELMKRGAIDFLTKPLQPEAFVNAVHEGLNRYFNAATKQDAYQWMQARFRILTAREREILNYIVAGMLNKQVALELGISEKTVKVHRGRVMRKLKVQSIAELVRFSDQLALLEQSSSRAPVYGASFGGR